MKIKDIYLFLDSLAPFKTALKWDNSGFLIGNINDEFKGGLICLDITDDIIDECLSKNFNLIITHHPVIFNKLNKITSDMLVYKLIKNNLNVISLHTNLDMAETGVNFVLAKTLNLFDLKTLSLETEGFYYKLSIFSPIKHFDTIKQNILKFGASIKNIIELGRQAIPFYNDTIKIDAFINPDNINNIINNLIEAYPDDKPIYEINKIYDKTNFLSLGLIGSLKNSYTPKAFAEFVKEKLNCKKISYISGNKDIKTVAVCSGSGSDLFKNTLNKDIDAYITSEIKHNIWLEAKRAGLTLLDAGHFNTENIICLFLSEKLNCNFKTNNFYVAENNIYIIEII